MIRKVVKEHEEDSFVKRQERKERLNSPLKNQEEAGGGAKLARYASASICPSLTWASVVR